MKPSFTSTRLANILVAVVLVGVSFHGFLTVWGSSLVDHYLTMRLWDDLLLLVLVGVVGYWLVRDRTLRGWLSGSLLVRLIAAYAGLSILLGFVALAKGDVTPKALVYGLLVNLRFLVWFLAVVLVARRSTWLQRNWVKLLLVPAAVVVVFAVLQYTVLPHNFLSHFGYNAHMTIAPIETINHNPAYIRVQSTLRGANPLGAYLAVILSALGVLFVRGKQRAVCAAFGAVALFALYASGSRSAWIATVLSLGVIVWMQLRSVRLRVWFGVAAAGFIALCAGAFMLFRHNVSLQNAVLHTQHNSPIAIDSNEAHLSALQGNLDDIVRQPYGAGPGTAGPASQYNIGHPEHIAENYFVQIAQETGWLGLGLFVAILVLVAVELYGRIAQSRLALAMFASLVGLTFINLLSHAWTDDTLAFVWWGLAAVAVGIPASTRKKTANA